MCERPSPAAVSKFIGFMAVVGGLRRRGIHSPLDMVAAPMQHGANIRHARTPAFKCDQHWPRQDMCAITTANTGEQAKKREKVRDGSIQGRHEWDCCPHSSEDTAAWDETTGVLRTPIAEEVSDVSFFLRLAEEGRRERQRRIDAGDETARLKFSPLALSGALASATAKPSGAAQRKAAGPGPPRPGAKAWGRPALPSLRPGKGAWGSAW